MEFGYIVIFGLIVFCTHQAKSEKESLYDTKSATSDLLWTAYPATNGWEEVSGLDLNGKIIRSYQVCKHDDPNTSNWVRTPYIESRGAQRAYIDVEFSMVKCDELKKSCRETFNLYYYEADKDLASSTFPPWRENPYIKIDTIAAGERFSAVNSNKAGGVNLKTWTLGPLTSNGFYIAAHDKGACMSLMSLKVYYYYCPALVDALAVFPKRVAGVEVTSLVKVDGQCVPNANSTTSQAPRYYCNSNGEWKVRTGTCHCQPGYQANLQMTTCNVCEQGKYKNSPGNGACARCPAFSSSVAKVTDDDKSSSYCACVSGYYRAKNEDVHSPCSRPPTKPTSVKFKVNSTSIMITWSPPTITGRRNDLYYNVTCSKCSSSTCTPCNGDEVFHPSRHQVIKGRSLRVNQLSPFTSYKFQISAMNGVSAVSKTAPQHALVVAVTSEAEPSAVQKVKLLSSGERNLSVAWATPQYSNGNIVKYQVLCSEVSMLDDEIVKNEKAPFSFETLNKTLLISGLDPGHLYSVRVRAATSAGYGLYSYPVTMRTNTEDIRAQQQDSATSTSLVAGIGVAVILLLAVLCLVAYFLKRNKKIDSEQLSEESTIDEKEPLEAHSRDESLIVYLPESYGTTKTYVEYPDPRAAVRELSCEIDPNLLYVEHTIGQGEFGEVCRGNFQEESTNETSLVAVKRLKHGANAKDQLNFLKEASTMAQFSHPNVVKLKGVVTKSRPQMIVTEYMENGSLDSYLKDNVNSLSMLQLLQMLKGIASGMRYLSQMKYVHRDLAARNILVNSEFSCKVSDFGLSRTLENDPHAIYTTQGGKIAIRWTAPECIRCRQFTSASDVWSFGIVMWEVMSYGEKPYWDMTNQEVLESIDEGYRLPAPYECPIVLHRLMVECWSSDPHKRPSMDQLCDRLDNLIQQPDELADVNMQEPTTPTTPITENPLNHFDE